MMEMDQIGVAGIEPPDVDVERSGGRRNKNRSSRGGTGAGTSRQSGLSHGGPDLPNANSSRLSSGQVYQSPAHVPTAEVSRANAAYSHQQQPHHPHGVAEVEYAQSSNRIGGVRTHQSFVSDLTSTAGYTLSGAHHQTEERHGLTRTDCPGDMRQLLEQGFSFGLAKALTRNADAFDHRIWVIDNSGSMQIGDGHRIVETGSGDSRTVIAQRSSRWEEIHDTVIYHCQMAAVLKSPTIFRLLNDPGPMAGQREFSVATGKSQQSLDQDIKQAHIIMARTKPDGVTPLTQHVLAMRDQIHNILPHLQRTGQRVAVVLATDGLPTDDQGYGGGEITDEFINALRSLEGLPMWLVIRLCTDEDKVTNFYNQLDGLLELSLEVLDDYLGEAREVYRCNPWLNYGLPMHRCRELGYHDRLFDLIDERALTKGELRECCVLLFGTELDDIPDPVSDWVDFVKYVKGQLKEERLQWNPVKKKLYPWIDVKSLKRTYGPKGKCTIM